MKKLNRRYHSFVFSTLMSLLMSFIMSFSITFYQFGVSLETIDKCLCAWGFALPFAFVAAQFVAPVVMKLTKRVVEV